MKTQTQEGQNQGVRKQSLTGGVVSVVVPYTIQFLGLLFGGIARSIKRL